MTIEEDLKQVLDGFKTAVEILHTVLFARAPLPDESPFRPI